MEDIVDFEKLKEKLQEFADLRDWNQFHNPKNLAMALIVEAAELVEIFQWKTFSQSLEANMDEQELVAVGEEIADIILYATRISDVLGVNIQKALEDKILKNALKYPQK